MAHLSHGNDALLARVRRIGGQVGAVERAMQGGADCAEILQLVAAVRGQSTDCSTRSSPTISRRMSRIPISATPSARGAPRTCGR